MASVRQKDTNARTVARRTTTKDRRSVGARNHQAQIDHQTPTEEDKEVEATVPEEEVEEEETTGKETARNPEQTKTQETPVPK